MTQYAINQEATQSNGKQLIDLNNKMIEMLKVSW